jgi:ATPase subunit of ABC transporter with duplicated ATPase domains
MSGTLTATGVVVTRGTTTVLAGIDLTLAPGDRVGVVGPNGAGKSTLLAVLAGSLAPDTGSVHRAPPSLSVGYLAQELDTPPGETVRESLARRTGVAAATVELERAAEALAASRGGAGEAYAEALDRFLALGAADLDARAEEVCADIGLDLARLDTQVALLSGGQRARVGLASVLLSRFDITLLDEPTNDLDFEGLATLEAFVTGLTGPAAIVSHDRRFLDRTVTEVLEIDGHDRTGARYAGGWSAYVHAREVAARHAAERFEEYSSTKHELEQRARMQRQWASVGVRKQRRAPRDNDKALRGFRINKTEALAAKVRTSEKRLARLESQAVDKPWEPWELRMSFGGRRSGDVVARLEGAVVTRSSWRLGPVDLEVRWADRVAVAGPNGAGKTTLIGALLGRVPLDRGRSFQGPGVGWGELDQGRHRLEGRLLDAFTRATGMATGEARTLLAKFGLGANEVGRAMATLSPGQRTRASLALLCATDVNCLVLDEPTNHLDLPAIEELESALDRFEGTLLLVTHDRALLERVAITRLVTVPGDGGVVEHDGP